MTRGQHQFRRQTGSHYRYRLNIKLCWKTLVQQHDDEGRLTAEGWWAVTVTGSCMWPLGPLQLGWNQSRQVSGTAGAARTSRSPRWTPFCPFQWVLVIFRSMFFFVIVYNWLTRTNTGPKGWKWGPGVRDAFTVSLAARVNFIWIWASHANGCRSIPAVKWKHEHTRCRRIKFDFKTFDRLVSAITGIVMRVNARKSRLRNFGTGHKVMWH